MVVLHRESEVHERSSVRIRTDFFSPGCQPRSGPNCNLGCKRSLPGASRPQRSRWSALLPRGKNKSRRTGNRGRDESSARIWNGNWRIQWQGSDQKLQAIEKQFQLHLRLHPEKPPVIHGENGISQKSEGAGHASYYISLTRLAASGELQLNGETLEVSGLAWMDHEFFTHQLESDQVGWDWLSLQLDDNTELMLFHIRRKDGSLDPFLCGHLC